MKVIKNISLIDWLLIIILKKPQNNIKIALWRNLSNLLIYKVIKVSNERCHIFYLFLANESGYLRMTKSSNRWMVIVNEYLWL